MHPLPFRSERSLNAIYSNRICNQLQGLRCMSTLTKVPEPVLHPQVEAWTVKPEVTQLLCCALHEDRDHPTTPLLVV